MVTPRTKINLSGKFLPSMNRTVIITGANGFVGRNVGNVLSQNGFKVTGIVRKGRITFGKTIVSKDLSERNLVQKIKSSNSLLHFIGKGEQTAESDYQKTNVSLTRNAIALCKKSGIKKIVYISGLGVDKKTTLGYFISKYKAEQEIMHSGLDYTIFRSSYIIGADDALSHNLRQQMKKHTIIVPGSGNYRFQPIFIGDVASIIIKSITCKSFSNKILDLVGPQTITYNQFVQNFAGKKTKIRKIDFEKTFHDALHNKGNFGVDDLSILVGDYTGNHKKLAKLAKMRFTRYENVLKSSRFS